MLSWYVILVGAVIVEKPAEKPVEASCKRQDKATSEPIVSATVSSSEQMQKPSNEVTVSTTETQVKPSKNRKVEKGKFEKQPASSKELKANLPVEETANTKQPSQVAVVKEAASVQMEAVPEKVPTLRGKAQSRLEQEHKPVLDSRGSESAASRTMVSLVSQSNPDFLRGSKTC